MDDSKSKEDENYNENHLMEDFAKVAIDDYSIWGNYSSFNTQQDESLFPQKSNYEYSESQMFSDSYNSMQNVRSGFQNELSNQTYNAHNYQYGNSGEAISNFSNQFISYQTEGIDQNTNSNQSHYMNTYQPNVNYTSYQNDLHGKSSFIILKCYQFHLVLFRRYLS